MTFPFALAWKGEPKIEAHTQELADQQGSRRLVGRER